MQTAHQMSKPTLSELLNDTGSNVLIGILAAIVRLAFTKEDSRRTAVVTFCGGVAFAVLVGYLIRDVPFLHAYSNGVVAVAALLGKEIVNTARLKLPAIIFFIMKRYVDSVEQEGEKDHEDQKTS